MDPDVTYDVQIWSVSRYKGKRKTSYNLRWRVSDKRFHRTFATSKLAEAFRATLLVGVREGFPFEVRTGLLAGPKPKPDSRDWVDLASAFVDVKWPHASARHRKGIAEGLTTATLSMYPTLTPAQASQARAALTGWIFNTAARQGKPLTSTHPPDELVPIIGRLQQASLRLEELATPTRLRNVLESLTLKLDGSPASPSTIARKRSALYSTFQYAVELDELSANPMDRIQWKAPVHTDVVDRRVVVNPEQARALLAAVERLYPSLEAFFACMYYAALRPSEVRHLRVDDLDLPADGDGWGSLHLLGSTQTAGGSWTDSGESTEDRALKHRARRSTRTAPAPPELVQSLRRHLAAYPPGLDGRIFVTRTGRAGVPVAPPFASPQSMGIVYRIWSLARREVFSDTEYASPLAKRPYDLRHAAVSLWLNAGVPPTQVAEWAGHSVNVLLRVYASCVVGQDEASRARVEGALRPSRLETPTAAP
ncbi:tyrosine-type recombinase/integrase [Intrasporangium mesophilum]